MEETSDIRDFASSIKEAKRREINKLQSTIEEVRIDDNEKYEQSRH